MNSKHPSIDQENPLVGINTREEEEKGRQLSPGQKVHIELPLRFKISAGFFNERRGGGGSSEVEQKWEWSQQRQHCAQRRGHKKHMAYSWNTKSPDAVAV